MTSADPGTPVRTFSIEFFPPRTAEGMDKLRAARRQLAQLQPAFFSVTFGAGGSTREGTLATVLEIRDEGLAAAPHISCVGATAANIRDVLMQYRGHGIRHLVALRGDLPSGSVDAGDFRYASELVEFIRKESDGSFHIEVACYPEMHPQAGDADADLKNFVAKIKAGADGAITQYFYNADAYFRFVEDVRKLGVTVPIVPGIMPISQYSQLRRFSEMCGAEIPRWIAKRLEAFRDDVESIREFGTDVVADLCGKLIAGGAPGIHFYTLNRAKATLAVCERLG